MSKDAWFRDYERIAEDCANLPADEWREHARRELKRLGFAPADIENEIDAMAEDLDA